MHNSRSRPRTRPQSGRFAVRLDGIPLAIELAVARLRSMTVEEVDRRLDHRFRLLTGGSRTALPRQQTLRSLIDWSYDLLNTVEQALFCRFTVFAGGWTLEAAVAVCGGDGIGEWDVLELLTSLADKNLVVVEERNGATRYRLLETLREYGRERLRQSGVEEHWRDRHLAYVVALAEEALTHLRSADQTAWLDRLETEHDNVRAALSHSRHPGRRRQRVAAGRCTVVFLAAAWPCCRRPQPSLRSTVTCARPGRIDHRKGVVRGGHSGFRARRLCRGTARCAKTL